ncbi:MAG: nitrate ABC transporter permease [Micrococcales bacterium 73-13]|nr:MAG: nitrate ABC transporter permease [Micrococcales bacterium 73-13]
MRRRKGFWPNLLSTLGTWAISITVGLLLWWLASSLLGPYIMPSPWATVVGLGELSDRGTLWPSIGASMFRIITGWTIGLVVGAPIGILMGRIRLVRNFLDPYVEILRFIPAIALVTVMVVWFGIGEQSKIALIVYTSIFVVVISTTDATLRISNDKVLAARSLGAGNTQVLWTVVLPSAVPGIITGARLAMANSFLTIVSAEMVAAREGLGTIIWTSYSFGHIDWIFAGIVTLGILGFCCDRILRIISTTLLARFGVK